MTDKSFHALTHRKLGLALVVVDIGYSSRNKSCGLAWTGCRTPIQTRFGEAIQRTAGLISDLGDVVLVIEAPLSTLHDANGNPIVRGEFERGRGWYWGPGAVCTIAAHRFLSKLAQVLELRRTVQLAEAFLANKAERSKHSTDANLILRDFWHKKPQSLTPGVEPLLDEIDGIPEVRVFQYL